MSLTHIPASLPPRNRLAEVLAENERLKNELADLEEKLRRRDMMDRHNDDVLSEIQMALKPLYDGLVHLFEQIDSVTGTGAISGASPKNQAAWNSWKEKLGGKVAEAIDVLLLHGEMNATQLRIHLHCATNYVFQVISKLNKAGLINKNGGKISLKEL